MENAIIIFIKNPVLGKVKTRLAATVGDAKALKIYLLLISHTLQEVENTEADKYIFFSDAVVDEIGSNMLPYYKMVQHGKDLGKRMLNAFATVFAKGYKKVIIIGTDCPGINSALLNSAFKKLDETQIVFGPATDGGYYLAGMTKLVTDLFSNIPWSTANVLNESQSICKRQNKIFSLLKELSDVDVEADLIHYKLILKAEQV
jgi:rSAM/selenodomain-associated transferase 1